VSSRGPREQYGTSWRLADGEWHRLHPATPLLRGGVAFVAILGIVIVNLRDTLIQLVVGGPDVGEDPVSWILANGYAAAFFAIVLGVLLLFTVGFYVSWRMSSFRITNELVEVRSGVLFRTNRRGRLDRIQGVNISRPILARVFGAAKLEVDVAGHDANVHLAYLGSAAADELRREILLLASGSRSEAAAAEPTGSFLQQRANELLAPELDPNAAPPESVVQLHLGRLLGSLILSGFTVTLLAVIAALTVTVAVTREYFFLFAFVPGIIGMAGFYVRRFTRSVRYSIAATPDGIRVGFGLLSTTNETLPPGRIHAIQVSQPLLWRPAGWWEIRINRASTSQGRGADRQEQTIILPVGNRVDVRNVLGLLLPHLDTDSLAFLDRGLVSRGGDDGFVNSPPRARVLRWFSRARNGFASLDGLVLLRRGAIWRVLVIVPEARIQSIGLRQGPLLRALRLASVRLHTVAGPVEARVGAIDAVEATSFFTTVADAAVRAGLADASHRWRAPAATLAAQTAPSPAP
jgi:putative membrane protein